MIIGITTYAACVIALTCITWALLGAMSAVAVAVASIIALVIAVAAELVFGSQWND
ncbi:MAG: hypothetical protein PHX82_15865 [Paracoccaceae bacterium]|jgi:hypothetical protein|nr:hypothetical protein [Paracoccaceae bacterium]